MFLSSFGLLTLSLTFNLVPINSAVNVTELIVQVREENQCKDGCFSKCCPQGMVYRKIDKKGRCVSLPEVIDLISETDLPLYVVATEIEKVKYAKQFTFLFGINCGKSPRYFGKSNTPFYLQKVSDILILGTYKKKRRLKLLCPTFYFLSYFLLFHPI